MTILVACAGGFIGAEVARAIPGCRTAGHADAARALGGVRTAIWCGRDPRLGSEAWRIEDDAEIGIARACAAAGIHLLSLGTRKVYAASAAPLHEGSALGPADAYGRQKLRLELALAEILGTRLTRLRLANIFGWEPGRRTFMGTMLAGLSRDGEIRFDMSPFTRRDFLAAEDAAALIAALAADPPGGVVNVGSGLGLETGRLAMALIRGYGRGRLVVEKAEERDAFTLDTRRLFWLTGMAVEAGRAEAVAKALGRAAADKLG
ncbi:MAG TPA: sugar nucleotide-binding protein [Geminicoccaceae bacterium]|nr:sugar nucleotide-binding protein [Geminicoccus sp.]HMU53203.1 sugar nucleotide-binding protein [Geminicoccaceae bacterium]